MEQLPTYDKEEYNITIREIHRYAFHMLRTYSGALHDSDSVKLIDTSIQKKLEVLANTGKIADFAYRSFAEENEPIVEIAVKVEYDAEWDLIAVGL